MARQTNININVNSTSAVKSIETLKKAFIDLNSIISKTGKDGKIKLDIDFGNADLKILKTLSRSLGTVNKRLEEYSTNINNLSRNGNMFNVTMNNITNNISRTSNATRTLNNDILSTVVAFETFRRAFVRTFESYSELTNSTFAVGIAGQMNVEQISKLNQSFLQLSTTVPSSAKDLADAVDSLIRTGRSYDESRQIIEQVAKLSTASGDTLKDTAQVVTKVMVALGVNGDKTVDTLNTMHSTAIQTASDMGYLADAFKNFAGTASVLVSSTGLAGKELDDYKQSVLDLTMSMTGSLANLGLSSSQAGTKVKQVLSKLTAMEKTAKNLFNESMRINNVQFEGELFDADALAELTKKDLPKAVELISKLYVEGKLSSQVMQKMFTGRHFMEASDIFAKIGGDVDKFVNSIAKGVDYMSDYDKNLFNINKQFDLFKNNIKNIQMNTFDVGKGTTGLLMMINEGLSSLSKDSEKASEGIMSIVGSLTSLTSVFGLATVSAGVMYAKIIPLLSSLAVFNPYTIGIGALASIFLGIGHSTYKLKQNVSDLNIAFDDSNLKIKQINNTLDTSENYLKVIGNSLNDMKKIDILEPQYAGVLEGLTKGLKEFKQTMDSISDIPIIDTSSIIESTEIMKETLEDSKQTVQNIEDTFHNKLNSIISDIASNSGYDYSRAKDLLYTFIKLQKTIPNTEERLKEFRKEVLKGQKGSNTTRAEWLITKFSENKEVQKYFKDLKDFNEKVSILERDIQEKLQDIQTKSTKKQEVFSRLEATDIDLKLKLFKKTGEVLINGANFSGVEGLEELYKEAFPKDIDAKIQSLKYKIDNLNASKSELLNKKDSAEDLKKVNKELEESTVQLENQLKIQDNTNSIMKQINLEEFTNVKMNDNNLQLMYQILNVRTQIASLQNPLDTDSSTYKQLKSIEDTLIKLLKVNDQEQKAKENRTKYQIKYVNYLKESLNLELESLKIGKTKGEQELLIYKYKLKQLELDRDIAKKDADMARHSLVKMDMSSDMRNRISKITDVKSGQEFIKDFYMQYKNVLEGKEGSQKKNIYEAVKVLVSAMAKYDKINQDIDITPLKVIAETIDNLPNTITNSLQSLQSMAEQGLINFDSYELSLVDYMVQDFEKNKQKVFDTYKLGTLSIKDAIKENMANLNIVESLEGNEEGIRNFLENLQNKFPKDSLMAQQLKITGDSKKDLATIIQYLISEQEDLNKVAKDGYDIEKKKIELYRKQLSILSNIGGIFSEFGSILGNDTLSKIGNVFNATESFQTNMQDIHIDWKQILKGGNGFEENLRNAIQGAFEGVQLGSSIGSMIGSMTGGGQSSQSGGALAGMIAGASSITGWGAIGMSVAGSLIGGMFDTSEKDKAEAERKTKESNKIYNKNTEALQKLAQNMSNLSGGVDGLNSTLISYFSKMPTVSNLSNVTNAMESLYSTMEKTRIFNDVAYQVTKTKSKKGFLGIGGGSTSWTETIEVSVNEMLKKYGFYGKIEDMTSQQLRDFSKWLDDYDLGDSDNFSILADAIEDYAEALDKFDKNIDNFFKDATMEAFEGISSLQQEELRQQIEDFYKNLGLQIDENTSKEIDKIAEEMSVMVTIMQDVRGQFLNEWRTSGIEAGKVFLKSMSPYVDAMLNNISQIYYDVYFSGVNESLEKEFKNLSEQLVELKKQGQDLDWSSVTDKLSGSFDKVLTAIINTKNETASFNDVILALQKQALDAGLSLSEIFDLGLMNNTQQDVMSTFKDALTSSESDNALKSIGNMLGDKIGDAMANKMIDNLLSDRVLEFSAQIDKAMSGNLGFDSLVQLANQSLEIGLMMQTEADRLNAIKSMFDFNSDIEYTTQNENIEYQNGTSQSITNIYNLNNSIEAGTVVESDNIERLAESLMDIMIEKLKIDKGIDLTKIS